MLHEDNHLLAVVKAAGDLVQGDRTGDVTLLERCKAYLKEKYAKPGAVFLGVVHRLDRPVSGVLLYARTSKGAARLCEQFRARRVEKTYRAVVEGRMPREADTLRHWLAPHHGQRTRVHPSPREIPGGKAMELRYTVLAAGAARSLVEVELITGAKHQIRSQLAAVGCPIVGDWKYASRRGGHEPERLAEGRAIALHAYSLTVEHPTRREPVRMEAPLPPYWPVVS